MRPSDIEYWALDVIRRVEAGHPNEDARVELKSTWLTDHWKAARLIAGHANAAGGEHVLWLVGVDQKKGVLGAQHEELANWYPQVKAHFNELPPTMTDINIPYQGKTVVALLFDADRAPFVVNNLDRGTITREVPWREGTSLRSATRTDLLRLLVPHQSLPDFDVLYAIFLALREPDARIRWKLELGLYARLRTPARVVIPIHTTYTWFDVVAGGSRTDLDVDTMHPPRPGGVHRDPSSLIDSTQWEVQINGPGTVLLNASTITQPPQWGYGSDVIVQATLLPVGANIPATITTTLHAVAIDPMVPDTAGGWTGGPDSPNTVGKWIYELRRAR